MLRRCWSTVTSAWRIPSVRWEAGAMRYDRIARKRVLRSAGLMLVACGYVRLARPRMARWGATDGEVAGAMPGDGGGSRAAVRGHPRGDHRRAARSGLAVDRPDRLPPGRVVRA